MALWHTSGLNQPVGTDTIDVYQAGLKDGVNTALAHYTGTSDPSTGASPAWGATEVGRLWNDRTDPANPVLRMYTQLTSGPTYGWRTMRSPKLKMLTAPQAVTFTTTSPQTAAVAWEDVSLASLLNTAGVQDTGDTARLVRLVYLRLRCKEAGTIPTSDAVYLAVREKGSTLAQRLYPQVAGRWVENTLWVGLNTSEVFQFMVDVAAASPSFTYEAEVLGFIEIW